MTGKSFSSPIQSVHTIQSAYMAQVQRRRLYGALTLLIFVILMASGFNIADDRNDVFHAFSGILAPPR